MVDDVLDFTQSSGVLGKPALNDLRSGIATAPVLLALRQRPELEDLTRRKFRRVAYMMLRCACCMWAAQHAGCRCLVGILSHTLTSFAYLRSQGGRGRGESGGVGAWERRHPAGAGAGGRPRKEGRAVRRGLPGSTGAFSSLR